MKIKKILSFFGNKSKERTYLENVFKEYNNILEGSEDLYALKYYRIPYFAPLYIKKNSKSIESLLSNFWLEKIPKGVFRKMAPIYIRLLNNRYILPLVTPFFVKVKINKESAPDLIVVGINKTKLFFIENKYIVNIGMGFKSEINFSDEIKMRACFSKYLLTPPILWKSKEDSIFCEKLIGGHTLSASTPLESIHEASQLLHRLLHFYKKNIKLERQKDGFKIYTSIIHGDFSINNIIKSKSDYYLTDFEFVRRENVWWDLMWLFFRAAHYTGKTDIFKMLVDAYDRENRFSSIVKELSTISGCDNRKCFLVNLEDCILRLKHMKVVPDSPVINPILDLINKEYEKNN